MLATATRTIGLGTVDIGEREIAMVTDCLRSGRVSPGPYQQRFEEACKGIHHKRYATFVNSGQSALQLALETIKLRDPDVTRVLCPATTYISTLAAVWNAGLEVVLCDVDPVDWLLDASKAPNDFHVALPVDLFGKVWTKPEWFYRGIPIVEDACEAFGATYAHYGDFVCLSFYASHSITTGAGGMVLTNDVEADKTVKRLANHGRASATDLYTLSGHGYDKSRSFVFPDVGFSYKSSDVNAALGLGQVERIHDILAGRVGNALRLLEGLRGLPLQLADPTDHTFQMFPLVCETAAAKEGLVAHLNARQIETRDAMPILTQPVVWRMLPQMFRREADAATRFPVAYRLAHRGFYIGCHQHLTEDDIDYVIDAVRGYF